MFAFFITIFLLSISSFTFGQDRINKKEIKPIPEFKYTAYSDTIPSAPFWQYSSKDGVWNKGEGTLYHPYRENQNFTNLCIAKAIGSNEEVKYVFFYNLIDVGQVEYASEAHLHRIMQTGTTSTYRSSNSRRYFTLSMDEFVRLKTIIFENDSVSVPHKINSIQWAFYGASFPHDRYGSASNEAHGIGGSESSMWVWSTTNNDEKVVRFRLAQTDKCSKSKFKRNYFEVSYNEFLKLFKNM